MTTVSRNVVQWQKSRSRVMSPGDTGVDLMLDGPEDMSPTQQPLMRGRHSLHPQRYPKDPDGQGNPQEPSCSKRAAQGLPQPPWPLHAPILKANNSATHSPSPGVKPQPQAGSRTPGDCPLARACRATCLPQDGARRLGMPARLQALGGPLCPRVWPRGHLSDLDEGKDPTGRPLVAF